MSANQQHPVDQHLDDLQTLRKQVQSMRARGKITLAAYTELTDSINAMIADYMSTLEAQTDAAIDQIATPEDNGYTGYKPCGHPEYKRTTDGHQPQPYKCDCAQRD